MDANMLGTELRELTDSELEYVAGGDTVIVTKAVVIPGTIESGAEKDPNIGTHTQLWLTTTTVKK